MDRDFSKWQGMVNEVVDIQTRLPGSPFLKSFRYFSFELFDRILSAEFWGRLRKLLNASSDNEVLFAVLDPNPVHYYKKHFGIYNWAMLSSGLDEDGYWEFLNRAPQTSPADSILVNSEVIVLMPPSQRWVIWAEHTPEICVLASQDKEIIWNEVDWVSTLWTERMLPGFTRSLKRSFEKRE